MNKDGTLTAKQGVIGSESSAWNIGAKSIYNGTTSISDTNQGAYVGIDGIRVYNDSLNSFTFQKNGTLEIKKGMSSFSDTSNTSGYFIGNDGIVLGGGKLKLNKDGTLTAKKGVIGSDSSAWNIGSKSIYNGTDSLTSTTQGAYIGIDGIRIYNDSSNSFTFKKNGTIEIKKGMTSLSSTSNGYFIGDDGIAFGGGNLKLEKNGTLTSKKGEIGGWTIDSSKLYTSNTNSEHPSYKYSGMSSGTYSFFAGSDSEAGSGNAYFSVTNQGKVTLTELYYWDVINVGQSGYDPDDESTWQWQKKQFQFGENVWKIANNNQTIKNVSSNGTVTLSNGKTFNSAASVYLKGSWSGSTFTASPKITNKSGEEVDAGGDPLEISISGDWDSSRKYKVKATWNDGSSHSEIINSSDAVSVDYDYISRSHKYEVTTKSGSHIIETKYTNTNAYDDGWEDYFDSSYWQEPKSSNDYTCYIPNRSQTGKTEWSACSGKRKKDMSSFGVTNIAGYRNTNGDLEYKGTLYRWDAKNEKYESASSQDGYWYWSDKQVSGATTCYYD